MLIPNNSGTWRPRIGFSTFGDDKYGPPVTVPCSIVMLNTEIVKTPIRATASASQSSSDEDQSAAKILFLPSVKLKLGDAFTITGIALRCRGFQPRFNVLGVYDHNECLFEVAASAN